MISTLLLPALLGLAGTCRGSDEFLNNMHKADRRKLSDEEKVEYYGRAIRAWEPADGASLLAHCHCSRGEAYYERRQFSDARGDFDKCLELDADSARAYFLRGRIALAAGQGEAAVKDFIQYLARDAQDAEGFLSLGEAYLLLKRHESALSAYRKAGEIDPDDFRPQLGAGRVAMARKDWRAALEALDAADRLARQGSPEVLDARAACRMAEGRPNEALADYGKALPLHEDKLEALERSKSYPAEVKSYQGEVAGAYLARGDVNEFVLKLADAADDYEQACDLGNEEACRKADALAAKPEVRRLREIRAKEEGGGRQAQAKRKRRRLRRPGSDAGQRIYAN